MSIEVQCYSGYRADQRPRRFRVADAWIEVGLILRHWHAPDAECFEVETPEGRTYRLSHSRTDDTWDYEQG
jgi:hypothetical protein